MVGFMETLYNACDSLFSACQEEGICDTTMAGTLLQIHALMCQLFTAPKEEMREGKRNLNMKWQRAPCRARLKTRL